MRARLLIGPLVQRAFPGLIVHRGEAAAGQVYLTFDDGPDPERTPQLLEILRRQRVQATFFLIGQQCERSPELVRQMLAEGHMVANHGYTHSSPREAPGRRYIEDVLRCQNVLEQIVGTAAPRLFRPPFGALGLRALEGLRREGFRVVLWSLDSHDSKRRTSAAIVAQRLAPARVRAGDIVLLHEDYAWTAEALPGVIEALRATGLGFATLASMQDWTAASIGAHRWGRSRIESLGERGRPCAE